MSIVRFGCEGINREGRVARIGQNAKRYHVFRCKHMLTIEEYRELELIRCDERFGRFADLRNKMDTGSLSFEHRIHLALAIEDRDLRNQERLINLLGLEPIKAEQNYGFDINALRERALEIEKRDRELEIHPELTGRVR